MHALLDEALVLAQEILDFTNSYTGHVIKGEIPESLRSWCQSFDASILSSTQIWFDLMWNLWNLTRPLLWTLRFAAELHIWINRARIDRRNMGFRFELPILHRSSSSVESFRINLQMAFDSVQSSSAQIDRELSMLQQSDRGFSLLRKHGWESTANSHDVTQPLIFQTRAPGDRSGIGFDASHARGSNRVSSSEVNVNFIPFPRARKRWHNTLRAQQEKLHWL
jgi:hypothetical protein